MSFTYLTNNLCHIFSESCERQERAWLADFRAKVQTSNTRPVFTIPSDQ